MRYRLRAETEAQKHSVDLDRSTAERGVEEELSREREARDHAHMELARTQASHAAQATVAEAVARKNLRELQHTLDMEQVRNTYAQACVWMLTYLCGHLLNTNSLLVWVGVGVFTFVFVCVCVETGVWSEI